MAKKSDGKKGKKGKDGAKAAGCTTTEPALDPPTIGLLLAAVIAGPPLYTLYQGGDIDLGTLLVHGGLVAAGCAFGVSLVNRLIADYRAQADRERRIQEMMDALEDVVHEGLPIQGVLHPSAGRRPPTDRSPVAGRPSSGPATPSHPAGNSPPTTPTA